MSASINNSILYFLLSFIVFEIIFYFLCKWKTILWDVKTRFGLFCAYFLGWLIGRSIIGDRNPLKPLEKIRKK